MTGYAICLGTLLLAAPARDAGAQENAPAPEKPPAPESAPAPERTRHYILDIQEREADTEIFIDLGALHGVVPGLHLVRVSSEDDLLQGEHVRGPRIKVRSVGIGSSDHDHVPGNGDPLAKVVCLCVPRQELACAPPRRAVVSEQVQDSARA